MPLHYTRARLTVLAGQEAHQLKRSCSSAAFYVSLVIISSYSARLEPVTQALQGIQLDILKVCYHTQYLLPVFTLTKVYTEQNFVLVSMNIVSLILQSSESE